MQETNESLVEKLINEGYLKTDKIIEFFKKADRKNFVTDNFKSECYINNPLPIGFGQTISQPLTVAFMIELLNPEIGDKILDIGSGSGWQTAILSGIVGADGKVFAIERIPELVEFSKLNLKKCDFTNGVAEVINGDGVFGLSQHAPFDKIICAASAKEIPETWKNQLKIGGIIVAPVFEDVVLLKKIKDNEFLEKRYFGFRFVPLISKS